MGGPTTLSPPTLTLPPTPPPTRSYTPHSTAAADLAKELVEIEGAKAKLLDGIAHSTSLVVQAKKRVDGLKWLQADFAYGTWMYEHLDWPYPTQAETKALADRTAESFRYVQNWFARSRRSLKSKLAEAEPPGCRPDEGGESFGDSRTLAKIRRGLFQVLRRHKRRVTSYDDSEPSAPHATKCGIDLLSEIACREHHGGSGSGGSGNN